MGFVKSSCLILCCLTAVAVFGGCRSTEVTMTLVGTPDLNGCEGDDAGTAVRVYVYELANDVTFRSVTREEFFGEGLGNEVLTQKEYRLFPDRSEPIPVFKPGKDTRFVGIAADMRCPVGDDWRWVVPVDRLSGKKQVFVEVGKNAIRVDV